MDSVESERDFIETELDDILTLNSCTTLVSELIKFILYRKQQLPYTFDRLKYLITKRNARGKRDNANTGGSSVERQFKVAEEGLAALELLFEKTRAELADFRKGWVSEVALLFGSTPMTPKQVYRIYLPKICLDHSPINHPERKHLFHLLQSVILSNNLTRMLTKPMNPTNMFMFIRRAVTYRESRGPEHNLSQWFIPKNRYEIPKMGQHFHIKFRQPQPYLATCNCQEFKIYSDDGPAVPVAEVTGSGETSGARSETEWFQACTTFKGFTDVYINGVSVADLWLRS